MAYSVAEAYGELFDFVELVPDGFVEVTSGVVMTAITGDERITTGGSLMLKASLLGEGADERLRLANKLLWVNGQRGISGSEVRYDLDPFEARILDDLELGAKNVSWLEAKESGAKLKGSKTHQRSFRDQRKRLSRELAAWPRVYGTTWHRFPDTTDFTTGDPLAHEGWADHFATLTEAVKSFPFDLSLFDLERPTSPHLGAAQFRIAARYLCERSLR